MRLVEALKIYRQEGPGGFAHGDTPRARATRMVHGLLPPSAVYRLSRGWRKSESEGRGEFISAFEDARTYLEDRGHV